MIRAARIRIDEGAAFEGECRMVTKEGTGKPEEKRSAPLTLTPQASSASPPTPKTAAQN